MQVKLHLHPYTSISARAWTLRCSLLHERPGLVGAVILNPHALQGQAGSVASSEAVPGGGNPSSQAADQYGLLGLLTVISMSDADVTTLALGTDLTTLGLHLNGVEPVYDTFASPWAEYPLRPDPDYKVGARESQHLHVHLEHVCVRQRGVVCCMRVWRSTCFLL